jgi:hypothetical protein
VQIEMARRLRDRFFSDATQQKLESWPCRLATIFALAVVLAATVLLVLRFAIVPEVKADIEDARLTRFAFATASSSSGGTAAALFGFNISIALNVRNPNKAMSIKYTEPLVASLVFNDWRLYNLSVVPEGHRHPARESELHILHPGGDLPSAALGTAAVDEFNKQNATGVFYVELRLSGEITLGMRNTRKVSLSCQLGLQLAPSGTGVVEFHKVHCKPEEPETNYF